MADHSSLLFMFFLLIVVASFIKARLELRDINLNNIILLLVVYFAVTAWYTLLSYFAFYATLFFTYPEWFEIYSRPFSPMALPVDYMMLAVYIPCGVAVSFSLLLIAISVVRSKAEGVDSLSGKVRFFFGLMKTIGAIVSGIITYLVVLKKGFDGL